MKKLKLTLLYICLLLVIGTASAYAQGPGFDDDVQDEEVPLDGGLSLLVAAGVGYGIKKVARNKSK